MLNGDGLRVVLWTSGCSHHCPHCHNPITWDKNGGIEFDEAAKQELFEQLEKGYTAGITFSGGDPLNEANVEEILSLAKEIKEKFPDKTMWIYSGYTIEELEDQRDTALGALRYELVCMCDVFVDGRFEEEKKDANYHWAGSTN